MTALVYPLLALLGIVVSAHLWERAPVERAARRRLQVVFLGGLFGMGAGAVLGYAFAEGVWRVPPGASPRELDTWRTVFGGKTVLGGLLGAYAGVELAKRAVGHREPTGDWFALTVPLTLALGRVGCLVEGCCLGRPIDRAWYALEDAHGASRWPASLVELAFNVSAWLALYAWSRGHADATRPDRLRGQLFHVYMIAYGLFRLAHEPLRDTPRVLHGMSLYQALALALVALGALRFVQRARAGEPPPYAAMRVGSDRGANGERPADTSRRNVPGAT